MALVLGKIGCVRGAFLFKISVNLVTESPISVNEHPVYLNRSGQ